MASANKKSAKQLQIDKTNATIVLVVSLAAVITAFSLVSVKAMLSQRNYQGRVISQEQTALTVATNDLKAANDLTASYTAFNDASTNIIGGTSSGTGQQDGTNSKIILDALPSEYDFPALVTSVDKLLSSRGFKVDSLSGTDDASQAAAATSTSPLPVEMPFQFGVAGSYSAVKDLVGVLERSVRPISINSMQLSSSDATVNLTVNAKTYFQPGKDLNVTTRVVK